MPKVEYFSKNCASDISTQVESKNAALNIESNSSTTRSSNTSNTSYTSYISFFLHHHPFVP